MYLNSIKIDQIETLNMLHRLMVLYIQYNLYEKHVHIENDIVYL